MCSAIAGAQYAWNVTERLGGNMTEEKKKQMEAAFSNLTRTLLYGGDDLPLQTNSYALFLHLFPWLDFHSFFSALFAHTPELLAEIEGKKADELEVQWMPAPLQVLHDLTAAAIDDQEKTEGLVEYFNNFLFMRLTASERQPAVSKCLTEIVGFDLNFVRFFVDIFDDEGDDKRRKREAKLERMVGGIRDNLRQVPKNPPVHPTR